MKSPFYKKWWFWIIIVLIIVAFGSDSSEDSKSSNEFNNSVSIESSNSTTETVLPNDVPSSSPDTKPEVNNRYLTKTEWAMYDTNYIFAVEVPGFDGDVFKAGTYSFAIKGGITKSAMQNGGTAKLPMMFDIYISNKKYSSVYELTLAQEATLTIGGMPASNNQATYTLNKGQYVYVVPVQDLLYEPSGYLTISLNK